MTDNNNLTESVEVTPDVTIQSIRKAQKMLRPLKQSNPIAGYFIAEEDIEAIGEVATISKGSSIINYFGIKLISSMLVRPGHPIPFDGNGKIILARKCLWQRICEKLRRLWNKIT